MTAVQALLRGAIDYAGLFPPASVDLETAVENYAAYRAGKDAWALGRLVLPATRLAEFAERWPERLKQWPISLLLSSEFFAEMQLAASVGLPLDSIEFKPSRVEDVRQIRTLLGMNVQMFVESSPAVDPDKLLDLVCSVSGCAKLRTGGLTAEAIPTVKSVASFLGACARRRLRMKATAGLHHAIRGEYRLTYEPDSAKVGMHGFLNFFVAAVLAAAGSDAELDAILVDSDPANFSASAQEIRWRDKSFSLDSIARMRKTFVISFGSCSFEEPMEELRSMRWIE